MSPWCIDYVPSYFVGVASAFALPACAFTTIDPVADMYRDGVSPEPGRQTLPTVRLYPYGVLTRASHGRNLFCRRSLMEINVLGHCCPSHSYRIDDGVEPAHP